MSKLCRTFPGCIQNVISSTKVRGVNFTRLQTVFAFWIDVNVRAIDGNRLYRPVINRDVHIVSSHWQDNFNSTSLARNNRDNCVIWNNALQGRNVSHWEMAAEKAKLRFLKNREKRTQLAKGPQQSSVVSLQIIGDGSLDCPPSVLVISDTSRYLFNCGEGTQRLLMECGTRNLSKLEHIFLTRMSWENVGGAIGMTITLKNIGLPQVSMYGPQSLREFKQGLQIFAKQEAIDLNIQPYTEGPFTNETMVVTPVPIFPTTKQDLVEPDEPSDTRDSYSASCDGMGYPEGGLTKSTKAPGVGGKRKAAGPLDVIAEMNVKQQDAATCTAFTSEAPKRKKSEKIENYSIAYVCKLHDKPGKLLVQKAVQMGLKPNLHFELVKSGNTIKLDDGRQVKPQDVLGPIIPGQVFVVLECPTLEYIDAVVNNDVLPRHFSDCGENAAALVFHMCPEAVLHDVRYQTWIKRFGSSTEHIIFNHSCKSLRFDASREQQTLLNQLHSDIFPLLPSHSLKSSPIPPQIQISSSGDEFVKMMYAEIYNRVHLKPAKGWEREFIISEDTQRYFEDMEAAEGFKQSLAEMRESFKERARHNVLSSSPKRNCSLDADAESAAEKKYPEVVFLGTGSAMPNKARNVSGILLNLSENKSMIMDCGEGTFGQLCRYYGDQIDDIIAGIQCIFISHIHADHHAGLIKLLRHWKKVTNPDDSKNTMLLIGPKRMFIWLNIYHSQCEPFLHNVRFIELGDLNIRKPSEERTRHEASLLARLSLKELNTVYVRHCLNAYGVTLTHEDGWKMVYSGDTMPSDNLIEAGKGADLLIHEATLEDGMQEEAKKKRHSMISEAIEVGQCMEAKFLLLTHFSQRYPKVPLIDTSSASSKIGIAFDNMRVSFGELDLLPLFLPTLKYLFAAEIQEMEGIRDKKAEKKGNKVIPRTTNTETSKVVKIQS